MLALLFTNVIIAFLLTYFIKANSAKFRLIDVPNHRSLHVLPTPRGGGIAFVLPILLSYLFFLDTIPTELIWGSFLIAALGLWDDLKSTSSLARLVIQVLIASTVAFFSQYDLNFVQYAAFIFLLVWAVNIYNFMDGSDGLAATYGITTSLMIALLFVFQKPDLITQTYPLLIMSASILGFLYWNLSPAKIFMGDVGSGFLGFVFAFLSFQFVIKSTLSLATIIIVFSIFIADTTWTLIARGLSGQKIFQAHRLHCYQKIIQNGLSHKYLNLGLLLVNIVWVLPLAILTLKFEKLQYYLAIICYVPLFYLCFKFEAGKQNTSIAKKES